MWDVTQQQPKEKGKKNILFVLGYTRSSSGKERRRRRRKKEEGRRKKERRFLFVLGYTSPEEEEEEKKKTKIKEAKLPTFWHLRYYLIPMPFSTHS
jgi:hypothetical protein